jgi:hypothetical protein
MVTIPIYDDLSLRLVGESQNSDVNVTGIHLGPLSLSLSRTVLIPGAVLQPSEGDRRRFRRRADGFTALLDVPARTLQLSSIGAAIAWTSLRLQITLAASEAESRIAIDIHDLRLSTALLPIPDFVLTGHLHLCVDLSQVLSQAESTFHRLEAGARDAIPLDVIGLRLTEDYFAIRWVETRINYWLRGLMPNVFDQSAQIETTATLRVLFGRPIPEIRLDWAGTDVAKTFTLPGMRLVTPKAVSFTLLLQSLENRERLDNLAFILTLPAGQGLRAYTNFAWERDQERELQPPSDDNAEVSDGEAPFLQLDAIPGKDVSIVLLQFRLDQGGLPSFFQQLRHPLTALSFEQNDTDALAQKTIDSFTALISLRSQDWGDAPTTPEPRTPNDLTLLKPNASFEPGLTVTLNPFVLPFLNRPEDSRADDSGNARVPKQRIRVNHNTRIFRAHANFATHTLSLPLDIGVLIGDLEFDTSITLKFNWETVAFQVEHSGGIRLLSDTERLPERQFLGLTWHFQGAPLAGDRRYHHLTLVTQNYDYKIIQAEGAVIEVDYTRASDEPITFSIRNLAISAKGLSITAAVTDRPARLNGVDTRFRFNGSQLSIVENRIQDFTLSGSGPLPPALVGDAMVDISLQFAQRNGNLTLVEGHARIGGDKLLNCQGTRFQFSVDAIGLKFVNDEKFHLYFTITGSAQFRLAPGDSQDGPLALLSAVKIELVDCPLTGDASVIARHVNFLIDLPKPVSFSLLGCFEMEIRGFGFVPQFDRFDGAGAMRISGQVKFAQGKGDAISARIDVHDLYVGLPRPGTFIPRLYFRQLTVEISAGQAFKLYGVVEFIDEANATGFAGEGQIEIKGLPVMAASFSFLRVRRDDQSPWVRAWFIFLQIEQVTFRIPYVELYIREVGLGFGYRYTIASIRAADEAGNLRSLLQELRQLSRTQGDLTRRDRWAVDLEGEGEALRWTIVLRALISQTSASPNSLKWIEAAERVLPCLYVMDAIIAFRSDLTFFMAVRCWFNTNYWGFVNDVGGLRERPLLSGFVLLSVRQKRFLAQIASNPDGSLGHLIPIPPMVERIVNNGQFSATLLIEPGLFHAELGWPNMLRWSTKIGPLEVDIRGGAIFRATADNLVIGISFYARGGFRFEAEKNLRLFGARVSADVQAAFGARYIGLIDFKDPLAGSAFYAGLGLEVRIRISLEFWIKFIFVTKRFRLSFSLEFTAAAEIGVAGVSGSSAGFRAHGTLSVRLMGRGIQLSVRIGFREDNIRIARSRTEPFLSVGLEATDVEAAPGVEADPGAPARTTSPPTPPAVAIAPPPQTALRSPDSMPDATPAPPPQATLLSEAAAAPESSVTDSETAEPTRTFSAPPYDIIWLDAEDTEDPDAYGYFMLVPRAETAATSSAVEEIGFLPAPPLVPVEADFEMTLPDGDSFTVEHYDPDAMEWRSRSAGTSFRWRVNWDATVITGTPFAPETEEVVLSDTGEPLQETRTLKDYLVFGFIVDDSDLNAAIPLGDPDPLTRDRAHDHRIVDDRVHNPTDDSYESAVRGALEQFRASPFFKRDPNSAYDRALEAAFQPTTTIYNDSGETDDSDLAGLNQQAHQLRGLVVQDMVSDLRDYRAGTASNTSAMVGFQMGLVFRYRGTPPSWLTDAPPEAGSDQWPSISQRLGPNAPAPDLTQRRQVRTFNVASANFEQNPPQFQRVEQFADANTIAVAWDLVWPDRPGTNCSACQADPEQHLVHYHVLRRALDSSEPEAVYTVKAADVLHFDGTQGILNHLQPRFQVVDHFNRETLDDQANLPVTGRSYLYTITPVDVAGHRGRPLTLVATRYPNEPPQVPVNAQLRVVYGLRQDGAGVVAVTPTGTERLESPEAAIAQPTVPPMLIPLLPQASPAIAQRAGITLTWQDPSPLRQGPVVPIGRYRLLFRRETLLPIGSYGLDNAIQGPRTKTLPTSNARPLPTDIALDLIPTGPQHRRQAEISLATLQEKGIFPQDEERWQPLSWRVYLQTESANGVPSALAPVELLLRVETVDGAEERQPSELEWIAYPIRLPVLPPEDLRATTGNAHVPMPRSPQTPLTGLSDLTEGVGYYPHPAHLKLVRFRWNQGPSHQPDYPLDLNAGYDLLQLDIDANTNEVFADRQRLGQALTPVQEVQMLPAEDQWLAPDDTLTPSAWEAWYPSMILRRRSPAVQAAQRSEHSQGPWYSWRESQLIWPEWPGLTDPERTQVFHPLLTEVMRRLESRYILDIQTSPPMQPGAIAAFLESTAAAADPYGWGVLQRLGLCLGLSLRSPTTHDLITGTALTQALQTVLHTIAAEEAWQDLLPHLYLELLVQPGHSLQPGADSVAAEHLLAIAQLSLRPSIQQQQRYGAITLRGQAGNRVSLLLTLTTSCSVIDQGGDRSQVELVPPEDDGDLEKPVRLGVTLPLTGETTLLFRSSTLPSVSLDTQASNTPLPILGTLEPFLPTDERSAYFTLPLETLAHRFAQAGDAHLQWQRLGEYLEFLNPDEQPGPDRIRLPQTPEAIAALLPDILPWLQRFFDASGAMTTDAAVLNATQPGPWLATAYPQRGTPAQASPDASGRLRYDHVIESRWAHTYRYYIRPYSRYELLWRGLLQSPTLFPEARPAVETVVAEVIPALVPDPQQGGLDVVLERSQPVAAPLILLSQRLDAPREPGRSPQPGSIWEVILAQHSEQLLAERNQTLARQLDMRGMAITVLRRFAYEDWPQMLAAASHDHPAYRIEGVSGADESPPPTYPDQPDAVDVTTLDAETARSLDLPQRLGPFHQGAMVLQWDALPYFYHHRLVAIAQTSTQVSRVNAVQQQDFEYQSPKAAALMDAVTVVWRSPVTQQSVRVQVRRVLIPLQRFWDCMPPAAQARWPQEHPPDKTTIVPQPDAAGPAADSPATQMVRSPASLPDPEVVYQIVERFSGNVEVQAEYFFDDQGESPAYTRRQLGDRILAEVQRLNPPRLPRPHGDYWLETTLQRVSETDLNHRALPGLRSPTVDKITLQDHHLTLVGLLTQDDLNNVLLAMIADQLPPGIRRDRGRGLTAEQVRQVVQTWFSTATIPAHSLAGLPPELLAKVDYPDLPYRPEILSGLDLPAALQGVLQLTAADPDRHDLTLQLRWQGSMSSHQRQQVLAYHTDRDRIHALLRRLVADLDARRVSVPYVTPARPQPWEPLPGTLAIEVSYPPAAHAGWHLRWTDGLSSSDRQALLNLTTDPPVRAAIDRLIHRIDTVYSLSVSVRIASLPADEPMPNIHESQLEIQRQLIPRSNPAAVTVQLTWTGVMTTRQGEELRQAATPAFTAALEDLITQVQAAMAGATPVPDSDTLIFQEAIADAAFVWPRVNLAHLRQQLQTLAPAGSPELGQSGLANLSLGANHRQLQWQGPLDPSPEGLLAQLRPLLRSGDPFLAAMDALMADLSAAVVSIPVGDQTVRIRAQLTAAERDRLGDRLGHPPGLAQMLLHWSDRQSLEELYQDGVSTVAVSAHPPTLGISTLEALEVDELTLQRIRPLTPDEVRSLEQLPGDPDFQAALRQLVRPQAVADLPSLRIAAQQLTWSGLRPTPAQLDRLRDLPGDDEFQRALGRLVNRIAATETASVEESVRLGPEPTTAQAIAPQGLDQVPAAIAAHATITRNNQQQQTGLTWRGILTDEAVTHLQAWAQLPVLMTAVQAIVTQRDRQVVPVAVASDRLPAALEARLQIYPGTLVWIGAAPNDRQRAALIQLQTNSDDNPPLQTALRRLLALDPDRFPGVAIAAPNLQPRPTLAQYPDLLRRPSTHGQGADPSAGQPDAATDPQPYQLVIQHDQIQWLGRVHHPDQLTALRALPGDRAFRTAVQTLVTQLQEQTTSQRFGAPVAPRPQPEDLPDGLREALLLGRVQLRLHGFMTRTEAQTLRSQFSHAPDQAAIQRLYDQALAAGLQGNDLLIRTRRGSAQPSSLQPLTPRSL